MDFNLSEWLNLIIRWIHVFGGIMWIGQTYFFTWLDGRFTELLRDGAGGGPERIWMVHSGGFYVVEKQGTPQLMPQKLHWFRWEAAVTWLSGVLLLVIVYYFGGLMVEDAADEPVAIIAGLTVLIVAWPVYDLLYLSPLGKSEIAGGIVSFLLVVGISYVLTHVMGGRAAYIHLGAMFGTLMAANVWMRILPAQRRMVAALMEGKKPDLTLALRARNRSKHNTFMVVPVVFIMISNHFPTASYGTSWNWLVLSGLVLAGWGAARIIRRA